MIKVLYKKASKYDYQEIKKFDSFQKLLDYMKDQHSRWIIEFSRETLKIYDAEEANFAITMYDDYVE